MSSKFLELTKKLYLFSFFDNFVLIYPLYALFFVDNGISASQISSLFIVWSLTSFVLELPSGALADKYPRRRILLIGQLSKIVGFLCWLLFRTYLGFLLGFIFWAVKVAFTSGSKEAYVYDELNRLHQKNKYELVIGRMDTFMLIGVIAGGVGATLLASHGYTLILILSILSVAISSILITLLPKAKLSKHLQQKTSYLSYIKEGTRAVLKNRRVFMLVLSISFIMGFGAMDEYFGLFFRDKGLSNGAVAAWITLTSIFAMIGSSQAHRYKNIKIKMEYFVGLWAGLLAAAVLSPKWLAPLFICLYMLIFSGLLVLLNSTLQHILKGKTRATASSFNGLVTEALSIMVFYYLGYVSAASGYTSAYKHFSLLIFSVAILIYIVGKLQKIIKT